MKEIKTETAQLMCPQLQFFEFHADESKRGLYDNDVVTK